MKSTLTIFLARTTTLALLLVIAATSFFLFPRPQFNSQVLGATDINLTTQSSFTRETDTIQESIPFQTKTIDDDSLEVGTQQVAQEGVSGLAQVETITTYYGDELYKTQVKTTTVTPPTDEIVHQGTKIIPKTLQTPSGSVTYIQKLEHFWATSYDSTCLGCSTTTATGMKQGTGVVAVDPSVIPLYSRLYIPGYGLAVAGDVGGAIKGDKIDLGFDSLNGQWSARYTDVYLLPDES